MKSMSVVGLGALLLVSGLLPATTFAGAGEERALPAPNYELASRWMPSKVGKLVFDTSVTPRWAETSDRFFYTFETAQGRTFQLVDPLRRTKAPLWDNAKMAAMLTNLTRIPFDSQHLPMGAARADHLGEAVDVDSVHLELVLDLLADALGPRLGAEDAH